MMHNLASTTAACNSQDPRELERLSHDEDPMVRSYVAENRYTPIEVLVKLTDDTMPVVHTYLLRNPRISREVCIKFLESTDITTRREASVLAVKLYRQGILQLEQKHLITIIKTLDKKADTLSIVEIVEELHKIRENNVK